MINSGITAADVFTTVATPGEYFKIAHEASRATKAFLASREFSGTSVEDARHLFGSCHLARNHGPQILRWANGMREVYLLPHHRRVVRLDSDSAKRNNAIGIYTGARGAKREQIGLMRLR